MAGILPVSCRLAGGWVLPPSSDAQLWGGFPVQARGCKTNPDGGRGSLSWFLDWVGGVGRDCHAPCRRPAQTRCRVVWIAISGYIIRVNRGKLFADLGFGVIIVCQWIEV